MSFTRWAAKNRFVQDTLTLMTGSSLAQLLTIGVSPILTRIYTPEDLSVFSLFVAIISTLGVIANWKYEWAILLPKKEADAVNILALSTIIAIGMSSVSLIIVALYRQSIANLLNSPELALWLWGVPICLLSTGLYQPMNYWLTRQKRFKQLAITGISRSLVITSSQLSLGFLAKVNVAGVLIGWITGQLFASAILIVYVWRNFCNLIKQLVKLTSILEQFTKYRRFPLYESWASLFNLLSGNLPYFLLSIWFSTSTVGHFGLVYRVISLPTTMIGASVSQIFFQRVSQAVANEEYDDVHKLMIQTRNRLFSLGFIPFLILMLSGPTIFAFVFGEVWYEAGIYASILAPYILLDYSISPVTWVLEILEKQDIALVLQFVFFLFTLISFSVGALVDSVMIAFIMFTSLGILKLIIHYGLCVKFIEKRKNLKKYP